MKNHCVKSIVTVVIGLSSFLLSPKTLAQNSIQVKGRCFDVESADWEKCKIHIGDGTAAFEDSEFSWGNTPFKILSVDTDYRSSTIDITPPITCSENNGYTTCTGGQTTSHTTNFGFYSMEILLPSGERELVQFRVKNNKRIEQMKALLYRMGLKIE